MSAPSDTRFTTPWSTLAAPPDHCSRPGHIATLGLRMFIVLPPSVSWRCSFSFCSFSGTAQARGCTSAFDRDCCTQFLRCGWQLPAGSSCAGDRFAVANHGHDLSPDRPLVDLDWIAGGRTCWHQPLHVVPRAFYRLLDRILAAVH